MEVVAGAGLHARPLWRRDAGDPDQPPGDGAIRKINRRQGASSGLMHRSKQHPYLITSSARESSVGAKRISEQARNACGDVSYWRALRPIVPRSMATTSTPNAPRIAGMNQTSW
jgi:hypothetical protein